MVIFGASSIVADASLLAYAQVGFTVAGLFVPDQTKAETLARSNGTREYTSVAEAKAAGLNWSMTLPCRQPRSLRS